MNRGLAAVYFHVSQLNNLGLSTPTELLRQSFEFLAQAIFILQKNACLHRDSNLRPSVPQAGMTCISLQLGT
jgi:hypothetical protein